MSKLIYHMPFVDAHVLRPPYGQCGFRSVRLLIAGEAEASPSCILTHCRKGRSDVGTKSLLAFGITEDWSLMRAEKGLRAYVEREQVLR